MSIASNFKKRIEEVFHFVAPNLPLKRAYKQASDFTGLGLRRVRAIYAGEARALDLEDDDALFEAEVRISQHFLEKDLEKEVARHADRLEFAAYKYAAKCPDTYRDRIARCRDLARRVRGLFDRKVEA